MMDEIEKFLATRIRELRDADRWSLAELARNSGVSKAMLSRIERAEASPTATTLVRIAAAFRLSLAQLLTEQPQPAPLLLPRDQQPVWEDPRSRYLRRQVFSDPLVPLELVEVTLPAGRKVELPAGPIAEHHRVVWVLEGKLLVRHGGDASALATGDRLHLQDRGPTTFANRSDTPCRYAICVLRGAARPAPADGR